MEQPGRTPAWLRRGLVVALALVLVAGGVLIARSRLLPAEEKWRVSVDRAQEVLDSNDEQVLLWSGGGEVVVLDRATGGGDLRIPLGAPLQNAALLGSGVLVQWQEAEADPATLGVATGPDTWLWQESVDPAETTVVGVAAATDRIVVSRRGQDPGLAGLDAATGETVWTVPGDFHSGWAGPMDDSRIGFTDQTQIGLADDTGRWHLLSTADGAVIADLGRVEPQVWRDRVVGNRDRDGCDPVVLVEGGWQPVDWNGATPPTQCAWIQHASEWGWLRATGPTGLDVWPVNLTAGRVGDRQAQGKPTSDQFPPTAVRASEDGPETQLVDTEGRVLWSHAGQVRLHPGRETSSAIREAGRWAEVLAGTDDVRRLELISPTGDVLAAATEAAEETYAVHLLSGEGVVFIVGDEVILLGN